MKRIVQIEIISHVLFWLFFAWVTTKLTVLEVVSHVIILGSPTKQLPNVEIESVSALPFVLSGLAIKIIIFYSIGFYFFKKKPLKKQKIFFFLLVFLTIAAGLIIELFLGYFLTTSIQTLEEVHLDKWMPLNVVHYLILLSFAVAYLFFKQWHYSEQERKIIENENLKTQLRFLKSQVNPHFLFNTLNNFFSIAKTSQHNELANGISKLSSMMRYMLYETDTEFIPLERELKHIQDYMELEQFRFSEEDNVITSFKIEGKPFGKMIAPLLLMPFIENAYKHGVDISESTVIHIAIEIKKTGFFFRVKNRKFKKSIKRLEQRGGVGLINVKRRLNLIYPEKHLLEVSETEEYYSIELNIAI